MAVDQPCRQAAQAEQKRVDPDADVIFHSGLLITRLKT
jgi:hypothetical protein